MDSCTYLLVDNGSKRPTARERLVDYAARLSRQSDLVVHPVSMLHAAPAGPGEAPTTFEPFLRKALTEGRRRFGVVPVFLGPSGAVTGYLQRTVASLAEEFPGLAVEVADFLDRADEPEDQVGLEQIVAENVRQVLTEHGLARPPVVLVDHGSPNPAVTAVRDRLAEALARRLGDAVDGVRPASMERREGDEYAFNDPLLEACLADPALAGREVVLAMLFLSPGRHAGAGGDIDEIVDAARQADPALRVHRTPLVGDHPGLVELLARRLEELRARG